MREQGKLKKNRDFVRVYKKGTVYLYDSIVVYVLKKRYGGIRVGFVTSKKTGGAVKRNRSRRIMRRAFENVIENVNADSGDNRDIILAARSKTAGLKSRRLIPPIKDRLGKAGIL